MARAALLLALILAACGPDDASAPFADSRIPPALSPRFYPPEGWAWGLVRVGDAPAQRYGVAATPRSPKAHILILTGQGETAEAWFETVSDLAGRGYAVWVLERAGQGGSGRFWPRRDLVHAPSLGPDIAAVKAMAARIVRPAPGRPLIVLGQGVGALVAVRAAQEGLDAQGLILSAPVLKGEAAQGAAWARRLGLGWLRAPGGGAWRRDAGGTAGGRGGVQHAWQLANPDLRMGGPSLAWTAAVAEAAEEVEPVNAPTLTLAPGQAAPHLAPDPIRLPWIEAVDAFAKKRIEEAGPALPEA